MSRPVRRFSAPQAAAIVLCFTGICLLGYGIFVPDSRFLVMIGLLDFAMAAILWRFKARPRD